MPTYGAQIDTLRIPIKGLVPESGTSFPGSPVEGQMFHRSDLKHGYQYLNGGWVRSDTGGSAAASHIHSIANVTGLQAALDAKAATSHSHTTAQVTGLDTALADRVLNTRRVDAGTGLTGGGDLTSNRTLAVNFGSGAGQVMPGSRSLDLIVPPDDALFMNGERIINMAEPIVATDAATKAYVDGPTAQQKFTLQATAPATPPTGQASLFYKTDGGLYSKNALGVERPLIAPDSAMHPNPDFELGANAPGNDWSTFWTSGAVWSSDTTTAIEGTRSAKLVSSSTGDTVRLGNSSTFAVSAGSTIRFSVWAKASVVGNLEFGFFTSTPAGNPDWFGGESQLQAANRTVGTGWQRYEASFTVPTSHTKARIYFSLENNRTWWLDASGSVVTAQAPVEPKTVAMFCNAGAAQGTNHATMTTLSQWVYRYQHPGIVFSSPGNFTIQTAGLYHIGLSVMFRNGTSSNGVRAAEIRHNNNVIASTYVAPIPVQNDYVTAVVSLTFDCPAGTVLTFHSWQTSGGVCDIHTGPHTQCYARRVGPLP